jgi:hypothetical protein
MADEVSERDRRLGEIFYHPQNGFGSVENTYKQARQQGMLNVTRQHVREFMAKQELRQRRRPPAVNSFVADFPRQEFQVDLADFGERVTPRYGFVAYDIFSKKAACFPIHSKLAAETTEALNKTFRELGYPTSIMCDEGGEFRGSFAAECKAQDIQLIYSRTGGRFVERFIRTLKMRLFERRRALGGIWAHYVQQVLDQYNNQESSSTGYTPNHIATHETSRQVIRRAYARQMQRAKFPVKREALNVGDHVKIRVKPPAAGYKETFNSWSSEVYTVESIDNDEPRGPLYHLEGYRRPLLRFELKKVAGVHRLVNGQLRSVLQEVLHERHDDGDEDPGHDGDAGPDYNPAPPPPGPPQAPPPPDAPRRPGGLMGMVEASRAANYQPASSSAGPSNLPAMAARAREAVAPPAPPRGGGLNALLARSRANAGFEGGYAP